MKTYILQKDTIAPFSSQILKKGAKLIEKTDIYTTEDRWAYNKEFVENTPEWFLPEVGKDYEILQYRENHDYNSNTDSIVITKVKRLSDGEVFAVGDEYYYKNDNNSTYKIESFGYKDGDTNNFWVFNDTKMGYGSAFEYIHKTKQPLFKTEDGKDVYEGDKYWIVEPDFEYYMSKEPAHRLTGATDWQNKYLSTKPAAEEYILINKPLLSLEDLLSVLEKYNDYIEPKEYYKKSSPLFKIFYELSKTKLNEQK